MGVDTGPEILQKTRHATSPLLMMSTFRESCGSNLLLLQLGPLYTITASDLLGSCTFGKSGSLPTM